MKHLNITVRGRVQGVWFRASTKEQADLLGVNGFVRNQDDGNVYLEAEAEDAVLDELLEWLKAGPPAARVDEVISMAGELEHFQEFEISR